MKLFFAFVVFCLASSSAFSQDHLFRVDAVGPDTAFRDGFTPPGTNRNLLQHAEGASCGPRDGTGAVPPTAYVELNDRQGTLHVIRARLQVMARTQPNPVVWRYDVRPSPNDYDVAATFAQRINPTARINLNTGRVAAALMRATAQQTWVATAPIPGDRIQNAHAFTLNQGAVVEIPNMLRINPGYVERPLTRNANPLPIDTVLSGADEPSLGQRALAAGQNMVSACACGAIRFGSRAAATDTDDSICRGNIVFIQQIADEQSFTTLSTPSGLEPVEHDDEILR